MPGRNHEGVGKIYGALLVGIWNVLGKLLERVGTVSVGYLEGVWKVSKSFCQFE